MRVLSVICWISMGFIFFSYKSYAPTNTLDTHMSPEEEKATGIYKLTPAEKKALQNWINKNHVKRPGAHPKSALPKISQVLERGAYVRLSDNSLWEIAPEDRPISQSWITPVEIIPEETGEDPYPYTLTNSLTGSRVKAKKIEAIPASPAQPYERPSRRPSPSEEVMPKNREEKPAEEKPSH